MLAEKSNFVYSSESRSDTEKVTVRYERFRRQLTAKCEQRGQF